MKTNFLNRGIPVSVSLQPTLEAERIHPKRTPDKKRLLFISVIAVAIAVFISFIAKLLVYLIDLFTNISFHGDLSLVHEGPANNSLGFLVIFIPVIGGIIVGLMAFYGSKAIRGHGIPEAMEQVLTNKSRIKPAITWLKPLSAAVSIGTGGPFGAEGPIIATGGAFGSTIGQALKITHNERKILLAAGATAGMSAIFGSPLAAVFLAIELLLFEFSPRSIIPVTLACITGAAGHHFLFEAGPVFPVKYPIAVPGNSALLVYSIIGIAIGLLSIFVTKAVYIIEDGFEKLPVHWMWWPAIGGFAVGTVGYFSPHTLGVGYDNIVDLLSGEMTVRIILSLCLLKFVSWAIALGSGTSGGTLAPLLTIGGASGALLGYLVLLIYPAAELSIPLCALVGMSALFAGASRALLTSIVFALETTWQINALLPLIASCTASYFVSFFLMKNSIMTEKISRRGVKTPDSYEPDFLEKITVKQVLKENGIVFNEKNTIGEVHHWLAENKSEAVNHFVVVNDSSEYKGIVSAVDLLSEENKERTITSFFSSQAINVVTPDQSLQSVVEQMAKENTEVLPVVTTENRNTIIGILTYKDIISAYNFSLNEFEEKLRYISLKNYSLRILIHGRAVFFRKKK
ncbi:MAG: chloride channel protein [Bacteroidia bacterium]